MCGCNEEKGRRFGNERKRAAGKIASNKKLYENGVLNKIRTSDGVSSRFVMVEVLYGNADQLL